MGVEIFNYPIKESVFVDYTYPERTVATDDPILVQLRPN